MAKQNWMNSNFPEDVTHVLAGKIGYMGRAFPWNSTEEGYMFWSACSSDGKITPYAYYRLLQMKKEYLEEFPR